MRFLLPLALRPLCSSSPLGPLVALTSPPRLPAPPPSRMQKWYDEQRVAPPSGEPTNGEEAGIRHMKTLTRLSASALSLMASRARTCRTALSRVGKSLYEPIFKHYTKKQWDKCAATS